MAKKPTDAVIFMTTVSCDLASQADAIAKQEMLTRASWLRRLIASATKGREEVAA